MVKISDTDIRKTRKYLRRKQMKQMKYLYLLLIIPVIHQLIFSYLPLFGISIAFKDFRLGPGIIGSKWVGLQNFDNLFSNYYFLRALKNTLLLSGTDLLVSMPCAILFALLINEIKHSRFKKIVQTISYMPHFLSWVIIVTVLYQVLSPENGLLNEILVSLGIIEKGIYFISLKQWFLPIYLIAGIWAGMGWGSIMYLAQISGIDQSQYESAMIDGANRLKRAWHITLPGMMPMIVVMMILSIGRLMNVGFDRIYNMMNDITAEVGDVLCTLEYRQGIVKADYSFSAALGLFSNTINMILLFGANFFTRKFSDYTIL